MKNGRARPTYLHDLNLVQFSSNVDCTHVGAVGFVHEGEEVKNVLEERDTVI